MRALPADHHAPTPPPERRATAAALLALHAGIVLLHADALRVPLVGDDYFFLEKAEQARGPSLLAPRGLVSGFYRPWSRELHFAWLHRVAGLDPLPFHLANLVLALAAAALLFLLVRRIAGVRVAAVTTAAAATLAPWGVLVAWASGAQDLWMIVAALLALHAALAGRRFAMAGAFAMALLSKETAATLPLALIVLERRVAGRPWRVVARDLLPCAAVLGVWAAAHPLLGGALWYARDRVVAPGPHVSALSRLSGTIASLVQLDPSGRFPAPEHGWWMAALRAAPGALALAMAILLAARGVRAGGERRRALTALGAAVAAAGWLPLAAPGIGWHAYYALFGALGAWVAIGAWLEPALAVPLTIALALLGAARADTPGLDWGTEWFQRRAAEFIDLTHRELTALHPTLPRASRLWFIDVPAGIGLLPGGDDSPVLRVWYGDPSLRAAFLSRYRARASGDTAGAELFFRYDRQRGWIEVDADPARDPAWRQDHGRVAAALLDGGDLAGARAQFALLAAADSSDAGSLLALGVCDCQLGDRDAARRAFARVLALPHAPPAVRAEAARGCP